jgi:hypothetical protein
MHRDVHCKPGGKDLHLELPSLKRNTLQILEVLSLSIGQIPSPFPSLFSPSSRGEANIFGTWLNPKYREHFDPANLTKNYGKCLSAHNTI